VIAEPWDKIIEGELVGLVEPRYKRVGLLCTGREPRAVDREKCISGGESRTLVAVDESMVL